MEGGWDGGKEGGRVKGVGRCLLVLHLLVRQGHGSLMVIEAFNIPCGDEYTHSPCTVFLIDHHSGLPCTASPPGRNTNTTDYRYQSPPYFSSILSVLPSAQEVLSPIATARFGSDHWNNVASGGARALDQYFVSILTHDDFGFASTTSRRASYLQKDAGN